MNCYARIVLVPVFLYCLFAGQGRAADQSSPNIVVIMTDDQSWVGTSLQIDPVDERSKSDYFRTPQIEQLAQRGMRFTRGYSPAPFCCPTRRSLVIGQTPARHIYQKDQDTWTKRYREQLSLPRMLKAANAEYRTAHFGKWDSRFDGVTPEEMGYDVSDGTTGNSTGGGKGMGGPAAKEDPKLAFSMTQRAIDFMAQQQRADRPFFVQVSHYAVHLDIFYRQQTFEAEQARPKGKKHSLPEFAAMTNDVDTAIGELMSAIDRMGLRETTYVFFLSDNGGRLAVPPQKRRNPPRNYPLRDGKGSMYEGGLRVPFVALGPGIAGGTVSHVPVTGLDLFPTIAELAGYDKPLPDVLDGGSMLGVLRGDGKGEVLRGKPFLIFHQAVARNAESAIMQGNFKLVKTWKSGRLELFDLSKDVSEANDLSKVNPDRTQELHKMMVDFFGEVGAETRKTTTKQKQKIAENLSPSTSSNVVAFAKNGGLKMFYDNRMYPQAVRLGRDVHVVWRDREGLPNLTTYDLDERSFSGSQMLLDGQLDSIDRSKYRRDHHYAPIIWLDGDEHLHVLFGCHGKNRRGVHLVSKQPRSTKGWMPGPTFDDSVSYPRVHRISGDRTLVYFRHDGHLGHWQYRISSDGGRSWDYPLVSTVDMNALPHDSRHASHAGSYHTTAVSADGSRLHVAFIWKVEDPIHNERYNSVLHDHTQRHNLYYFTIDLDTGTARNVDGHELALPIRKRIADERCLVWDTEGRVASVGPSIVLDEHDKPHFMLPVSDATPYEGDFYHVSFEDNAWRRTRIARTLHPFNSSHLVMTEEGTLDAFLIVGDRREADAVGDDMDQYGWGQRIEKWQSDDRGRTWHKAADLTPQTSRKFQSTQFISSDMRSPMNDMLLFYGWDDAASPGTAYLWDGR